MDGNYNNYSSSFGGGGGGGFMPGETNSPAGGKTGDRDNKTLRPVTVKQVLDASQPFPEAPFQIDGADVANVLFMGQVRNISSQSTNVTYIIDDGTGECEVKKWIDSATADNMDTDDGKAPGDGKTELQLNGYARVFGSIKSFANKRYIGAHSVRPLSNINELHTHLLEATAVHLFFTRGPPGAAAAGGNAGGADAVMGGADNYGGGQNKALASMSLVAKKIYNLLKTEPQDDTGLHMQVIASKLNMPATEVARAGEELLGAGVIFSTMDEQTWAILEY
ncbi:Winged helix-turn-helix transcription repressor DNA-binding [Penicillium italicum]|uniref:Winged helix-turn-helix transcription repressor DNA-binding n=1 Tax=Penicillium italicum TaxID=40296 RepID=A0A0A2LI81_PENIT|nr:Winged helix-turn-helix transcription repressor DNA-binding [Penicillium italicum]